jgi:hypothetical protein
MPVSKANSQCRDEGYPELIVGKRSVLAALRERYRTISATIQPNRLRFLPFKLPIHTFIVGATARPRPSRRRGTIEARGSPQWITSTSSSTAHRARKAPCFWMWKTPEERASISANGRSGRMDIGRFASPPMDGSLDSKVMLEHELQPRATPLSRATPDYLGDSPARSVGQTPREWLP